jgi:hypothetical protein
MEKHKKGILYTERTADSRDSRPVPPEVVHFSLPEITEHFSDGLRAVRDQFDVADSLVSEGREESAKTIWRSQIVLAEGLLDFHIHEISKYCLFRMFNREWEKSERYDSIMIPMREVEKAVSTNYKNWFFNFMNDKMAREVFLSSESMRDQLNLAGLGFAEVMARAFPEKNEHDSIRHGISVVGELFRRRNEIAHQSDRSHASAELNDITKEYTEDYISKIEAIVNAIDTEASCREREYLNSSD